MFCNVEVGGYWLDGCCPSGIISVLRVYGPYPIFENWISFINLKWKELDQLVLRQSFVVDASAVPISAGTILYIAMHCIAITVKSESVKSVQKCTFTCMH